MNACVFLQNFKSAILKMYSAMVLQGINNLIFMRKSRKTSWRYELILEEWVRIWLSGYERSGHSSMFQV